MQYDIYYGPKAVFRAVSRASYWQTGNLESNMSGSFENPPTGVSV